MAAPFREPADVMRRALELAARGMGAVEPNPAVGAVLVDNGLNLIAEGWHERYGGPHAEIEAISRAGRRAAGATLFVTLEPCCHHGKTGPCTDAIAAAGIVRVVVAARDPFPEVDGQGIRQLQSQGIAVEVGLLAREANQLIAPFRKLIQLGRPWVHAKWSISLDGKIASRSGHAQWVSGDASRAVVHRLRGRMDAVLVGARTAALDDPLLTTRPSGPRIATRIVVDSNASLPATSRLARTARDVPLLVAASAGAPQDNVRRLVDCGAEVLALEPHGTERAVDVDSLLLELGRRKFTNVLVEGGSRLLGSFFDGGHVDEVHVFVAPKIVGGVAAPSAVAGLGVERMNLAHGLSTVAVERLENDVYINGRLRPA